MHPSRINLGLRTGLGVDSYRDVNFSSGVPRSQESLPPSPTTAPASPSTEQAAPSLHRQESHRAQFERFAGTTSNVSAATPLQMFAPGEPGARAEAALRKMELFRGMTSSEDMKEKLRAMEKGEPTVFPLYTGFREYLPGKPLQSQEKNTFKALAEDFRKLQQEFPNAKLSCMLADSHARHNNIPPQAVPKEKGGIGVEGFEAYYKQGVEPELQNNNIHYQYLSDVYKAIGVTAEEIYQAGKALVHFPGDPGEPKEGMFVISEEFLKGAIGQARNMTERYPTTEEHQRILALPEKEQLEALTEKAKDYIIHRVGEGLLVDPHLGKAYEGANAIAVNVADPDSGPTINLNGLFVKTKSWNNQSVNKTSWAAREKLPREAKPVTNASKYPQAVVDFIKDTKKVLGGEGYRVTYGSEQGAAATAAVKLFDELAVKGAGDTPAFIPEEAKDGVESKMVDAFKAETSRRKEKQDEKSARISAHNERVRVKAQVEADHPEYNEKEVKKETTWRINAKEAFAGLDVFE